jgi:protein TonB
VAPIDSQLVADQFGDDDTARGRDAHRAVAFIVSVATHVLILIALVFLLPKIEAPQHEWVLAYLVDFGDSGSPGRGAGGDAAGSPPAPAHEEAPAAMPPKPPHARHLHRDAARASATPERAASQPAAIVSTPVPGDAAIAARSEAVPPSAGTVPSGTEVASAKGFGLGLNAGRGANGTGGDGTGSSFAHAEYGHNPAPIYPVEARRRAEHGTVLLRIKVAVDGAVELVEIAQSSGFDLLDNEALETVRSRWRFVPARRDGVAVESWCEVPIRFALTEAQAN